MMELQECIKNINALQRESIIVFGQSQAAVLRLSNCGVTTLNLFTGTCQQHLYLSDDVIVKS